MSFSLLTSSLQKELKSNLPQIIMLLRNNPATAYAKIAEIGISVGKKYKVKLLVNFPHENKINEFDLYGKRDLSIIVDMLKKNFPIPRQIIKNKASEIFVNARIDDAYMYEGKEGVRVTFESGRIDVLPHSLHIWCIFDERVNDFCNWLLAKVYERGTDLTSINS